MCGVPYQSAEACTSPELLRARASRWPSASSSEDPALGQGAGEAGRDPGDHPRHGDRRAPCSRRGAATTSAAVYLDRGQRRGGVLRRLDGRVLRRPPSPRTALAAPRRTSWARFAPREAVLSEARDAADEERRARSCDLRLGCAAGAGRRAAFRPTGPARARPLRGSSARTALRTPWAWGTPPRPCRACGGAAALCRERRRSATFRISTRVELYTRAGTSSWSWTGRRGAAWS